MQRHARQRFTVASFDPEQPASQRTAPRRRLRRPLRHVGQVSTALISGRRGPVFAGGHVEYLRWMELPRSGAAVRCTPDGWVLRRPEREEFLERFDNVCAEFGVDKQLKLAVPQQVRDGVDVDASDRVQAGARLLRALAAAGL